MPVTVRFIDSHNQERTWQVGDKLVPALCERLRKQGWTIIEPKQESNGSKQPATSTKR